MTNFSETAFPFKSRLSLKPLLDFWEHLVTDSGCGLTALAPVVREKIAGAPEFQEPIDDLTMLDSKQGLLDLLMSVVFPPAFWANDCAAAFVPFQFTNFYATPAFKTLFMSEGAGFAPHLNITPEEWQWGKLLKAYLFILQKFYNLDLAWHYPLIARVTCPKTGLAAFLTSPWMPGSSILSL